MTTRPDAPLAGTPGLPPATPKLLRGHYSGLLFVGDPHMTTVKPGRRLEEDFLSVVLDKITQARELAEARNLLVVFLGDMTDLPGARRAGQSKIVENTNAILAGFARAMQFRDCLTIPGNHDMSDAWLTPDTTLYTMRELRLVNVIEPSGPGAIVEIDGLKVGIGGTPYGQKIPRDVRGVFPEPVDRTVWLTHDLFIFDEKIPGLTDPFEIRGCDVAVNGHDHTSQAPRTFGQTTWYNPGNITRMSVDHANDRPAVWEWTPQAGMVRHELRFAEIAFDMVGLQVAPDERAALVRERARSDSLFAALIQADSASDMARSDSGDLLKEDIERLFEERSTREPVKAVIRNLHLRAPGRMQD